jgi:hypothetical protein
MIKQTTLPVLRFLAIACCGGLGLLLSACGGDDSDPNPFPPETGPVTLTQIFNTYPQQMASCGPGCHEPDGSAAGGPDLRTPGSFHDALVVRNFNHYAESWFPGPTNPCSSSEDFPYVYPGAPNQSALLAAVVYAYAMTPDATTGAPRCEGSFVYHSTQYSPTDAADPEQIPDFLDPLLIDQLIAWIRDGARL